MLRAKSVCFLVVLNAIIVTLKHLRASLLEAA
jgi:hypothetical protein